MLMMLKSLVNGDDRFVVSNRLKRVFARGVAVAWGITVALSVAGRPAAGADQPESASYRTDADGESELPWYQPVDGQFPPAGSAHYFAGELIRVDHLKRSFVVRVDRTDSQRRSHFDLPVAASMLPYGSVHYHGAPASLADVPLGTHLHGWYYPKDPDDASPVIEGPNNRVSTEVDFTRCLRLEDDFTYHRRRDQQWRIEVVDRDENTLEAVLLKQGRPTEGKATFDLRSDTRVWMGDRIGSLEDIRPGQTTQINLTWATLYGPGRIRDIWLDQPSRDLARQHQLERHRNHVRLRGLPGWVDEVDNAERIVTITFFSGVQQSLLEDLAVGQQAGIAVAQASMMTYDPVNDRKRGPVLEVNAVEQVPGCSGVQVKIRPDLLLEGFRPDHLVRVYPGSWPVIALPREERYFGRE